MNGGQKLDAARAAQTAHKPRTEVTTTKHVPTILSREDFIELQPYSQEGGTAEIYLATNRNPHNGLERKVILKKHLRGIDTTETEAWRIKLANFRDKIAKAEALCHPNVVKVRGVFTTKDEFENKLYTWVVMDEVKGKRWDEYIDGDVTEILEQSTQLLSGLDHIHNSGEKRRAHRDVKPTNVMVQYDGLVKLLDLGAMTERVDDELGSTIDPTLVGTANYISPEQDEGNAQYKSDLYSAGITLYELLTGHEAETGLPGETHKHIKLDSLEQKLARNTNPRAAKLIRRTIEGLTNGNTDRRYNDKQAIEQIIRCEQSLTEIVEEEPVETTEQTIDFSQGWDVPRIEVCEYMIDVVKTPGKRFDDMKKEILTYAETEQVSERDRGIIGYTLSLIDLAKKGDKLEQEIGNIKNYLINQQIRNPEKIFGYTRKELETIQSVARGGATHQYITTKKPRQETPFEVRENEHLRGIIEIAGAAEIPAVELARTIERINSLNNQEVTVDKDRYKANLKRAIQRQKEAIRGILPDRSKQPTQEREQETKIAIKYIERDTELHKLLLYDPRYFALALTMEEQGLECRLDKPEDHDKNKAVDTDHVTITGHEFYEEKEFEPAPGIGLLPRAFYTSILTGIGATIGYLSGGDLISAAQIGMSFLGGSGLLFVRGTSDKCLVDLAVDYGLAFPYHKLETTVVKAVTSFDQVKVRTHYSQQGILEDLHGLFKEYSDRVAQIPATIEEAYEIKHPNKTPHLTINMARQSLESYESREFVKAVEDSREMRKRLRTGKPATPF